jgi:hypothetical protein
VPARRRRPRQPLAALDAGHDRGGQQQLGDQAERVGLASTDPGHEVHGRLQDHAHTEHVGNDLAADMARVQRMRRVPGRRRHDLVDLERERGGRRHRLQALAQVPEDL